MLNRIRWKLIVWDTISLEWFISLKAIETDKNWQSLVLRYIIHYHQLNWIEPLLVITIIFHSCFCSFNEHLLNINVVSVIDAGDKAANNRRMVWAFMGIYFINVTINIIIFVFGVIIFIIILSSSLSSSSPLTLGTNFLLMDEVKDGERRLLHLTIYS